MPGGGRWAGPGARRPRPDSTQKRGRLGGGHPEEGSVASLQDLVEPMQEDAEEASRAKGSKKEARRAAKAAAKQRAKIKKQGKK